MDEDIVAAQYTPNEEEPKVCGACGKYLDGSCVLVSQSTYSDTYSCGYTQGYSA